MLASLSYRPWRSVGFTLEETASYRQQFTILDYSIFGNAVGPRYAYLGSDDRPWIGYAFELQTLGSSLLLLGHSLDAGYRHRLGGDLWLGVRYHFRYRTYYPDGFTAFTGPAEARAYVRTIRQLLDAPVEIISVGPDREQTLFVDAGAC